MLKKLFNGELPLRVTFWKYGILGLTILYYAHKMFRSLSGYYAKGSNWINFFRNFNISNFTHINAAWLLCYFAVSLFLVIYSVGIVKGIWKSAATYDKSVWLAQSARIIIIAAVVSIWWIIIRG